MRPVTLYPPGLDKNEWVRQALTSLAEASHASRPESVAQGFTPSNVTDTRTFDADTVTLPQLADVVGTLIQDLARMGAKRE